MVHFLSFAFDPRSGELFQDGARMPLAHQPAEVLRRLLATPGSVVTRQELIDAVWGAETHVNFQDNLNYCIRQLRQVLGDDARSPRFIETLPKRGYRFVAPVRTVAPTTPPARSLWAVAAIAASTVAVIVLESTPNNHHEVMVGWLRHIHALVF